MYNLVDSESAEGKKSAVLVNEKNFTVENEIRAVLKRLRYELLQVLNLQSVDTSSSSTRCLMWPD